MGAGSAIRVGSSNVADLSNQEDALVIIRLTPRWLVLLALAGAMSGCYTVGFHAVETPEIRPEIPAHAGLYLEPEIVSATYSFRSWAAGIGNRWTVLYGERIQKYARVYLDAAFQSFGELSSIDTGFDGDVLVHINRADYRVARQAGHVTLGVVVLGSSGKELFRKDYSSSGPSGMGKVFVGGVFAQKSATRSSTDEAMKVVLLELIDDIRRELASQ